MGKIKKLLGVSAVLSAAVCGAAVYKKKYGMRITDDNDFEDDLNIERKDKKVVDITTDGSDNENSKVTITFNKTKAKKIVSDTLDDIGDAMYTAKDKIVETIGEEHVEDAKETVGKVKNKLVDTIGEENITKAREKISTAAGRAKDKADEIFTEENLDMAKEKMSEALDKTKDVIKKTADKVKSLKNENDDDFSNLSEDITETSPSNDSFYEDNSSFEDTQSTTENVSPVINDTAHATESEPIIIDDESSAQEAPVAIMETASTDDFDLTGKNLSDSDFEAELMDDLSDLNNDEPEISLQDVTEVHAINQDTHIKKNHSPKYDFLADEIEDFD